MTQFTPGPWKPIFNWNFDDINIYEGKDGKHVATALNLERDSRTANARLIAASPDMYEALEEVSAFAEMAIADSVNIIEAFEYIDDMVRKCQAALKLATGKGDSNETK